MLEKGARIGGRTNIGFCHIGEGSVIASNVSILSGRRQHNFQEIGQSILDGDDKFKQVKIGKNVFIGEGCIIMDDIGDDTIIGAGSVVVKKIPERIVTVGNPAKVIKRRI